MGSGKDSMSQVCGQHWFQFKLKEGSHLKRQKSIESHMRLTLIWVKLVTQKHTCINHKINILTTVSNFQTLLKSYLMAPSPSPHPDKTVWLRWDGIEYCSILALYEISTQGFLHDLKTNLKQE